MTTEPDFTEDSLSTWITGLKDGDQAAAERLWHMYFEKMVLLARRKLRGASTAATSEEDVALSAFKSFCLGIQRGRYSDVQGSINLWPLLVTLTINKSIDQLRYQNRLKRGGSARGASEASLSKVTTIDDLLSSEPTAESVAVAAEMMELLLDRLGNVGDSKLQSLALASIEGESVSDIAKQTECSPRTVQRKLKTIRAIWESLDS
ncbi:ECF-type sigma factor [Planctomicrobium sp.]|nr:ECF-type sigma factor [Planctomicrobium sp.]MDB4733424.1 ECF-type sigma factor [Planctomicrobium sp.]